jgi:hypothetical protein
LQGATGDALHAVLCAAGYNLRWLLRAMVRLGLKALLLRPGFVLRWVHLLRQFVSAYTHSLHGVFVQTGLGGAR